VNAAGLLQHFDRISEAPDAVPRLRRFILDLAVRGKLAEQDPKDEPAAKLLERIRAEKVRLAKEGKQKKTVIGSVEDGIDAPFSLPPTWTWGCLGDVAQYGLSEKVDSNKDIAVDTWVLDLEDIEKDTSRLIERMPSSARPFRSTKTIFKRGDVLFGKLRPYLNKVLVADQDGVCTTEIIPIRGYCELVPEYVKLVLKSPLTMARVDRLMYGMKMPRLGTGDAAALSFPLPPLAEQPRIVAKVDELMVLCDWLAAAQAERESRRDRVVAASLHRLNNGADPHAHREHARFYLRHLPRLTTRPEEIQQLRQTVVNLAVRGKLVRQDPKDEAAPKLLERIQTEKEQLVRDRKIRRHDPLPLIGVDEEPFSIPESWEWTRLGTICSVITDGAHHTPKYQEEGIPFLSVKDVSGGTIDFSRTRFISETAHRELCKRCMPEFGDILLTKVGTTGIAVTVDVDRDFSIFVSLALLKFSQPNLDRRYLRHLINSPFVTQQSADNTQGIGNKNLVLRLINQFVIPLPPLAEQHRIVAKVDELMALCERLKAQLTAAQTESRRLLEATLHQALSDHPGNDHDAHF